VNDARLDHNSKSSHERHVGSEQGYMENTNMYDRPFMVFSSVSQKSTH